MTESTVPPDADGKPPSWRLLAILASTFTLKPALSRWLYHAAVALHDSELPESRLDGDLGEGKLVTLKAGARLGTLVGPSFEARLSTPDGDGIVRFIVTREGIAELTSRQDAVRSLLN